MPFYGLYVLLACLAIAASLGFSQTAIYRSTAEVSSEISSLEQDLARVDEASTKLAEAKEAYDAMTLDEDVVLREARQRVALFESERQQANAKINAYWSSGRDSSGSWKEGYSQGEYSEIVQERATAQAKRDQATAEVSNIESGNGQKTMAARVDALQAEYDDVTALLGTSIEITARLREARSRERDNMGAAIMFTLIMETFGRGDFATTFRFVMLMFAACLIEVLIFIFSPAVVIDRKMLNRFRRFLSKKDDVDALIKKFETENAKFATDDRVKLSRDEKKQVKKMADEMTAAAVLRLEERHREEVEQLQSEVERYTELRTESEDSYRGLLESHKEEVLALRKKIQELEREAVEEQSTEAPVAVVAVEPVTKPVKKRTKGRVERKPKRLEAVEPVFLEEPRDVAVVEENQREAPVEEETPEAVVEAVVTETPANDIPVEEAVEETAPEPENTLVVELTEPDSAVVVDKGGDVLSTTGGQTIKIEPPKVKYRFGECTEAIKDKFVAYVTALVVNDEKGPCRDASEAAISARLTTRQKEVFDQRLTSMTINGTPLMRKTDDGFVNDFTLSEIVSFTTHVIDKA